MANNGFLVAGVCVDKSTHIRDAAKSIPDCQKPGNMILHYQYSAGAGEFVACHTSSPSFWMRVPISLVPDCEIDGPSLTEAQQIEAINALFPHAVAIIAVAWGFKFLRSLIHEWVIERNSGD